MSGFKWSDVRDDFRRIKDRVSKSVKKFVDGVKASSDMRKAIKHTRTESRNQLREVREKLDKERKRNREAIEKMEGEIRQMAERHYQSMEEQKEAFLNAQEQQRESILSEVKSVKKWTKKQLKKHDAKFEAITKRHELKINQLENDVQHFFQKEQGQEERANKLIDGLKLMIEEVQNKDAYQKFAPNVMGDDILPILDQAINNYNNQDFQTALARGQDAFLQLTRLDRKILRQQTEFDRLYNHTLDAITTFLEIVRANREIEIEDGAYVAELDYWTKEKYSALETEAEKLKETLIEKKLDPNFTQENIEELTKQIEGFEDQRIGLIQTAIERIYLSHRRAQLADLVEQALKPKNFRLVSQERGYAGGDIRESYLIKLKSIDGAEIVAMISPDEKTNQNSLSINTYKDKSGEDAKIGRWNEIKKALNSYGIEFGEQQSSSQEEGVKELYNVKEILQKGSRIPEKVLKRVRSI